MPPKKGGGVSPYPFEKGKTSKAAKKAVAKGKGGKGKGKGKGM